MIFYINENGAKKCKSPATKEGWRFPLRQHMQKQKKTKKLETAWNHRNTSFTKVFHLAKTLLQESDVSIIFCCHITSGKTEKRQKSATITRICGNGVACDSNTKTRFQLSGLQSNHFSSMMWNVLKPRRQPDFITSYQCQQYVYVNDQCLLQSSSCIKERYMATRNEYE